jgi:hypothetical protein
VAAKICAWYLHPLFVQQRYNWSQPILHLVTSFVPGSASKIGHHCCQKQCKKCPYYVIRCQFMKTRILELTPELIQMSIFCRPLTPLVHVDLASAATAIAAKVIVSK